MVGVAQSHTADCILMCQLYRPFHAEISVEVAGAVFPVVTLHNPGSLGQDWDGVHIHTAFFHTVNKLWEPVQAMGIHPVQAGVGVKGGGTRRPLRHHAVFGQHPDKFVVHGFVWYAHCDFLSFSCLPVSVHVSLSGPLPERLCRNISAKTDTRIKWVQWLL